MQIIATDTAPAALGPYSQAIKTDGLVFCSGQLGMDPADGSLAEGVGAQTARALDNLAAVLQAAGSGLDKVVKTTVFLADMDDFGAMNTVYEDKFSGHKPARAAVQVARLPKDGLVEIECIALAGGLGP